ncbi:MAG: hypothetical protein WAN74_01740 [Thermoplasmata archaeon]
MTDPTSPPPSAEVGHVPEPVFEKPPILTFTVAMLPTVTGIAIALGVFFWIGARAPSNE